MNTKDHELMARMKISKAVAAMAIPSVISSLVTVVYNMADTFFVGQTGDPLQVAAVSLTNPIFFFYGCCEYVWYGRQCRCFHSPWRTGSEADETGVGVYYLCFSGGRCFLRGCIACFYAAHSDLVWSE